MRHVHDVCVHGRNCVTSMLGYRNCLFALWMPEYHQIVDLEKIWNARNIIVI